MTKRQDYITQADIAIDKLVKAVNAQTVAKRVRLLHESRSRIQLMLKMVWRYQNERRRNRK